MLQKIPPVLGLQPYHCVNYPLLIKSSRYTLYNIVLMDLNTHASRPQKHNLLPSTKFAKFDVILCVRGYW